mmetsp:Transcript_19163/g.51609  ORF Transcript_19163/g.51609 Transcript_19163/m.51609 type:complete len:669 (-) Transcript_19163:113-2119(-)
MANFWRSFSMRISRSASILATRCLSSSAAFSCALSTSACTATSRWRSSMLSWSWALRLSRPKVSSTTAESCSRSFFTSSLSTSWLTILSSLSLTSTLSACVDVWFLSSSSPISPSSLATSVPRISLRRFPALRSLRRRLSCAVSMVCCAVAASTSSVSALIFLVRSRFSASVRSPCMRLMRRSSSWSLKSALYTSSRWRWACSSSLRMRLLALRLVRWAPLISARVLVSSWRCLKRCSDSLYVFSLSSWRARSARSARTSASLAICSTSLAACSSVRERVRWDSSSASARMSAFFLRSRARFLSSRRACMLAVSSFLFCSSAAALESVFFITSIWSVISSKPAVDRAWAWRTFSSSRSSLAICASSSSFPFSCAASSSSRSAWSACFSRRAAFCCWKRSPAASMSLSRRCMFFTASSHWRTSCWRSAWSLRKSSAVLSSTICCDCVSVTSASSSERLTCTSAIIFSIWRVSSRILPSSALVYFASAMESSSFWRAASAHCSSSSWFQFILSLNASICSFPLNMAFCAMLSLSWSSATSALCFFSSAKKRPFSRSASCFRWSSVSISCTRASTSCCVVTASFSTFARCSRIVLVRSTASASSPSRATTSFSRLRSVWWSSLFCSFAKSGRSLNSNAPSPTSSRIGSSMAGPRARARAVPALVRHGSEEE